MLRRFVALLLPLVGFAAGSWFGLGSPDASAMEAAAGRAVQGLAEIAPQAPAFEDETPPGIPPPLEPAPPNLEVADLSDIPRLNPDASLQRAWLLAEGPARPLDRCARRLVTFTFDDGPFPETTPTVLRILARHNIRATFFLIGRYLEGSSRRAAEARRITRQIAAAGHLIGNHTHDHGLLTAMSRARALAQIDDGAAAIARVTGEPPRFFRPPYGALDGWLEKAVKERGLEPVLWSVAVDDMLRDDYEAMLLDLRARLEYAGGGIVLLHDVRWPSVKAFHRLVYWLEAHRWDPAKPEQPGYEIVDLLEYMRATAAAPQPYENREQLEIARRNARTGVL